MNDPSIFGTSATRNAFVITLGLLMVAAILAALTFSTGYAAVQRPQPTGPAPADQASQAASSPDCGPNWHVVSSPNASAHDNDLYGIAALSSSDAWAVGDYQNGSSYRTLIEHWDGSAWNTVYSPNRGASDNYLSGVAAVSSNNVWAVGEYLSSSGFSRTLIEHWNGTAWNVVTSDNANTNFNSLKSVAAISSSDIWAVGHYLTGSQGSSSRTLTERWNGTAWNVVSSDNPGSGENRLDGVSALSSNNVWAVGHYQNGSSYRTLIERWNGNAWNTVASANPSTNDNMLYQLAVISSGNIWALGQYVNGATDQTLTEHWNGTAWHVVSSPNPSNAQNVLSGVAAVSSSDIWAVGYYGPFDVARHSLIEQWDGTTWNVVSSPDNGTQINDLEGVAAVSSSDIWAVGSYANTGQANRTLVMRYNPCPAPSTSTPTPRPTRTATPTNTPFVPPPTPTLFPWLCGLNFEDVPTSSPYYFYVQCLACQGIISGYPCGGVSEPCNPNHDPYFRPNAHVTRGQIAKIIALAAGINTPVEGQTFEDVPPGSPFYTYTEQLYALGAISGHPCGSPAEPCVPPDNKPYFRPHARSTRGQLARMDSIAAGYQDTPTSRSYQDVPFGSTFYTYTQRLADRDVMGGYPCGNPEPCVPPGNLPYFRPNANVTRGQTSKIVANTFFPDCQTP